MFLFTFCLGSIFADIKDLSRRRRNYLAVGACGAVCVADVVVATTPAPAVENVIVRATPTGKSSGQFPVVWYPFSLHLAFHHSMDPDGLLAFRHTPFAKALRNWVVKAPQLARDSPILFQSVNPHLFVAIAAFQVEVAARISLWVRVSATTTSTAGLAVGKYLRSLVLMD